MYRGKKVTAVIVAAGRGTRFGGDLPKQFLKIENRTVLEMAIEPFQSHPMVDALIVASSEEYVELCSRICERFDKMNAVVIGGEQRQDSVRACLDRTDEGLVLIHDGARPFVTAQVIDRVIEGAYNQGACVPCVPVKDTVRQTENVKCTSSVTLERSSLFCVQTPQGFDTELIRRAYIKAEEDGFIGTDDGVLAERLGAGVAIAEGDYANIKITTREDLPRMETGDIRMGSGYDVHQLTEGRKLVLGGVEIPFERGLLGHSDADVLLHALMDALLGAAALGDIGKHFPDTDEKYRGISSIRLLEKVKSLISDAGYTVGNTDITVIAQKPKIAAYIPAMRKNIADTLGIGIERVNVKGTTTENLGFVGRCEGIACEAVCVLYRQ